MGLLRETSSRDRQATILYTSLAALFVVLYLFLFPLPLPQELTLIPAKATILAPTRAAKPSAGGASFVLGDQQGSWDAHGVLQSVEPRRPQVSVWKDKFAWYDAARSAVVVETPNGEVATLPGEQYPVWVEGRLYTLDENRLGLASWTSSGRLSWRKQFSSLITSLAASADLTVVGTLDGRLQVFAGDGKSAGGFQPGGSRLPVIYNVAVDPESKTILALAGVDPKRFLVLQRGGTEFRPVFHKPLQEARPWPTPLGFLAQSDLAYYQNDRGLVLLHPRSPDAETVIAATAPSHVRSLDQGRLLLFVDHTASGPVLHVSSVSGTSLMTLPFAAQNLLLEAQGNTILLGIDQTLLQLEVKVQ